MINVEKSLFGKYEGQDVYKYELKNSDGFQVNVLNFGGIITEIFVKNKEGQLKNVVLGYAEFEEYIDNPAYPGAIIGRTAGRIENGIFSIDGIIYDLNKNNGENSLHGGNKGLNTKIFNVRELGNGIELSYKSPHMEEGYPGNVNFEICYLINESNHLTVEYKAVSDRKTYINLTNHTYFNLSGDMEKNGDDQILKIDSDQVCELSENMIPTGNFIDVSDTVFDMRKGRVISDGINEGHPQFAITRAYDHPFVLNRSGVRGEPEIVLYSPHSGVEMEVCTTERAAVVYTGNYLDDVPVFDSGYSKIPKKEKNERYLGVAIETQDFPNGVNERKFRVKLLEKGKEYYQKTIFKFNIK